MSRLAEKTVVITGGSGGIGKVTAERALEEGANVVLVDIDEEALKEVKNDLNANNRVITVKADVSNEDDVERYVKEAKDKFGSIDVFFNNAGIIGEGDYMHEKSYDNFTNVMKINAGGVFLGLKHVLKVMRDQGSGSIINTSSVDGLRGDPIISQYSTSKHAVVGLTKSAALENAELKIRVNSIHPAPVGTGMMDIVEKEVGGDDAEKIKKQFLDDIPMGEYAEPLDIANLVIFLGSDESRFVTGSQYRVDGGMGAQQ